MATKEIKKVYLAGPDVFRPDAVEFFAKVKVYFATYGLEALIPLDTKLTTSREIFEANVALIMSADAVIANVNPFRGTEPDSGTVWETAYAYAHAIPVVSYSKENASILRRTRAHFEYVDPHFKPDIIDGHTVWPDRMKCEDFSQPLNLMLMESSHFILGDIKAAMHYLLTL